MIEIGQIAPVEVPELPFGYLAFPEHAGKTFIEAFLEQFKHLGNLLENSISGDCQFDEEGLLKGSNPLILSLSREGNLLPENEYLYPPTEFARAFNKNPDKFKHTYQDLGIAVAISPDEARGRGSQIEKLAQDVFDSGFRKARPNSPIFVPHTILTPKEIKDGNYVFGLKSTEGLVKAQAYAANNPTKTFNTYDEKTALPIPKADIPATEKSYNIYTVPRAGVFRVCSDGDQSSGANYGHLAKSYSDGRVVVGSNVPQEEAKMQNIINAEKTRRTESLKNLKAQLESLKN